jgi:hypothetical protein
VGPLAQLVDHDDPAPVVERPDRLLDLARSKIGEVADVVGIALPVHVGELSPRMAGARRAPPANPEDP